MPPTEATLTIEPPCSPIHRLWAERAHRMGPSWLTVHVFCNAPRSTSASAPGAGFVPALLTRMSHDPNSSTARRTVASACSASSARATMVCSRSPAAVAAMIRSRASSRFSGLRPVMITPAAPLRRNSTATASPMPLLAPVTTATLPSTRISIVPPRFLNDPRA